MQFFIISGLSGAGKSKVAAILEDLDFYCVDNMPVVLMPIFAELCLATKGRYDKVALVTDVRGQDSFDELFASLERMRSLGVDYKIIYIEASNYECNDCCCRLPTIMFLCFHPLICSFTKHSKYKRKK